MGLFSRHAGLFRPSPADGRRRPDRYADRPRRPMAEPPAGADPAELLGRNVLAVGTRHLFQAYGLDVPVTLCRSYAARHRGLEVAADAHGTVTSVFLHFHGDDGFPSWTGDLPAGAGAVPRRAALWAALGRPGESGDPYRDRFLGDFGPSDRWTLAACTLHAQYALDGEHVRRITLTAA